MFFFVLMTLINIPDFQFLLSDPLFLIVQKNMTPSIFSSAGVSATLIGINVPLEINPSIYDLFVS